MLGIVIAVMLTMSPAFVSAEPGNELAANQQLVGLYETGAERVLIREREGNLELIYDAGPRANAIIETYVTYPLLSGSSGSYRLLSYGPMSKSSAEVAFVRDRSGRGISMRVGDKTFARKFFDVEQGKTFQIKSLLPTTELRQRALVVSPPVEAGVFLAPELVELESLDATIKLDIRYAGTNNFMGIQLYEQPRAFLQRPAAEALVRVNRMLKKLGLGLIVYDAYRPWYVTKMFWEATPDQQKVFVADPSKGSRHNRGCAVDIGLYRLDTGEVVDMGSDFDEFSMRAYPTFPGGTSEQRARRALMQTLMAAELFTVYPEEWWHFDYVDWKKYPILNLRFAEL
jgi:D-alanyl-D-alanine dipeptidase